MSIPTMEPEPLIAVGRALAPLRNEGVLIVGSGFIVHNLRLLDFRRRTPESWAAEFDAWAGEALAKRDVDALVHYRKIAPGVELALPTHEHFVPVLVALGASLDRSEKVTFPITGNWLGGLTKRSVQFG
jgi:4,5-DOPA dioxygenase extradiol